ncbi:hypothetical protein CF98_02295 [Halopseudomonas bauzanensis]|nr:hypothetical protein CF98_02295 [Halopseudomonas bauzanensis]
MSSSGSASRAPASRSASRQHLLRWHRFEALMPVWNSPVADTRGTGRRTQPGHGMLMVSVLRPQRW